MELLTASRLRSARACQRLHKLRYIDGYRPAVEAETLRFGTLVHAAREAWWRANDGRRMDAALAAIDAEKSDPFDRAKARAMMIGYDGRWAGVEMEVLAVEQEFCCELRNPATGRTGYWALGGKIDSIVRIEGRNLVSEFKTSAEDISQGSDYWRRLRMDSQVSIYFEGSRSLGHDVEGCLYDVLGKPALKPYKATPQEARKYTKDGALYKTQRDRDETPDEFEERLISAIAEDPSRYYQRAEVSRLDGELADGLADVWMLGQQIRESERAGRFPRNPDACIRYGRTCEFFAVCSGEASLSDASRFTRIDDKHPELAGSASGSTPREVAL